MMKNRLKVFIGPESNYKFIQINRYLSLNPDSYRISTREIHNMFNRYDFNNDFYMDVVLKATKDMIHAIKKYEKEIIVTDWYFKYEKLTILMALFDNVELICFDSPLDSYLKFIKENYLSFPDILSNVNFYDQYKELYKSNRFQNWKLMDNTKITFPSTTKKDLVV
jgi:hypothetical protein